MSDGRAPCQSSVADFTATFDSERKLIAAAVPRRSLMNSSSFTNKRNCTTPYVLVWLMPKRMLQKVRKWKCR